MTESQKCSQSKKKIELFARNNYIGWDNWGLEIPDKKIEILSQGEIDARKERKQKLRELSTDILVGKDGQLSFGTE